MGLQVPYSICTEILTERDIWKTQSRYRENLARAMQLERGRNNRSARVCGPYTYVCKNTAEAERKCVCRVSERQEYVTDISTTRRIEIQIRKQAFLVSRILCEYSRKERKSCTGIHTKPRKRGYNGRPDKHKGIYGSVQ